MICVPWLLYIMDAKPKPSKRRENILSSLNVIIEGLNIAESLSSITPAKAVFSTVSVILTMIRVSFLLFCHDLLWADKVRTGLDDQ